MTATRRRGHLTLLVSPPADDVAAIGPALVGTGPVLTGASPAGNPFPAELPVAAAVATPPASLTAAAAGAGDQPADAAALVRLVVGAPAATPVCDLIAFANGAWSHSPRPDRLLCPAAPQQGSPRRHPPRHRAAARPRRPGHRAAAVPRRTAAGGGDRHLPLVRPLGPYRGSHPADPARAGPLRRADRGVRARGGPGRADGNPTVVPPEKLSLIVDISRLPHPQARQIADRAGVPLITRPLPALPPRDATSSEAVDRGTQAGRALSLHRGASRPTGVRPVAARGNAGAPAARFR